MKSIAVILGVIFGVISITNAQDESTAGVATVKGQVWQNDSCRLVVETDGKLEMVDVSAKTETECLETTEINTSAMYGGYAIYDGQCLDMRNYQFVPFTYCQYQYTYGNRYFNPYAFGYNYELQWLSNCSCLDTSRREIVDVGFCQAMYPGGNCPFKADKGSTKSTSKEK